MVPKTSMTSRIKAVSPRKTDVKLDSGNTCIVRKTRAKSNLENMCMVQKKTPIKSEVNTSVPIFEESYLRNGRKRYRLTRNPANIAFLDILPEDISSNEEKCDKKQKRRSQRISMQSISKTCKVENLLHETKPIVIKSEPIDDDFENEKKILQISNDQFLKSVKQEKIDSEDLNIKNKPINNLHSWLGIQFNTTNIKPVKRKSKKKKTKINFSPNTIEKYFINLNEAKTDKISIKTEPESPNDSFAQNYITVIKNICRN